MNRIAHAFAVLCLLVAASASATTFIVPTDAELIGKASAIAIGQVQKSYSQTYRGTIETVYEVLIERSLKGPLFASEIVKIHSLGGFLDGIGVVVPGTSTFTVGERDLLFLTNERGRWQTVDMMVGKFRFARISNGEQFLVRDYDNVEAYDRTGLVHSEPLRREREFLQFVQDKISRRVNVEENYIVEPAFAASVPTRPSSLTKESQLSFPAAAAATYATYLTCNSSCPPGPNPRPIRWETFGAGVPFRKNNASGLAGAGDGGISVIQNGVAAWKNDCGSNIDLTYAGETSTQGFVLDGTNVIEFNDPRGLVTGSCGGSSCVVATTQMAINATHDFAGAAWWSLYDTDVIFNDGYVQQTSTQASMNHELGHALGFRHSNASYLSGNDSANTCTTADSECTTTDNSAIMFWRAVSAGPTLPLMDWDRHAARTVYPGGSCGVRVDDFNSDGRADLVWRNTVTGQQALWFMNGVSPINTIFISGAAAPWDLEATGDLNNDGSVDLIFRNYTTGQNAVWFMNGSAISSTAFISSIGTDWKIVGSADFNGDGYDDLVWRNTVTGQDAFWYMNGATVIDSRFFNDLPLAWSIVGTGDFDQDGQPDLILRNYTSGQNAIWYFTNSVLTSTAYFSSIPTVWEIEASGDFDGNGTTDIVFRNYQTGQNAMWFMNNATVTNTQFMFNVATEWKLEGGR